MVFPLPPWQKLRKVFQALLRERKRTWPALGALATLALIVFALSQLGRHGIEEKPKGTQPPSEVVARPAQGFNYDFVRSTRGGWQEIPLTIPVPGKLAFNAEFSFLCSARTSGRLDHIRVFEGGEVKQGDVLAELYSPDYISAEKEYLLARDTVRAVQKLRSRELRSDALATLQAARNRLKVLGASDPDIDELDRTGNVSLYLKLRAPISGTIVKRNMDPGAFVNTGDSFMMIADPTKLWFFGNVFERDYPKIRIGQELLLRVPALGDREFSGTLNYIAPAVDPNTHTLPIRCDVPNPTKELRPEFYVEADLVVGHAKALIFPRSALLQEGDQGYVILAEKNGYRKRPVVAQSLGKDKVAILSGLQGDEEVVVAGAILLNQLLLNQ
jgi:Cu(I)/Ag(I) efflux system membrane fusion protein